jgi:hypothetical protein
MLTALLKIYFFFFFLGAVVGIPVSVYLAATGSVSLGHTLYALLLSSYLVPVYGYLHSQSFRQPWLWWIHVPGVSVIYLAGITGVFYPPGNAGLSVPDTSLSTFLSLLVHAPLLVMGWLFLFRYQLAEPYRPNKSLKSDAGKAGAA